MNRMFLREVERNETLVRVARASDAQREDLISEYQSRWEGECPELCVSGPVHAVSDTQASKRSPNIMAN